MILIFTGIVEELGIIRHINQSAKSIKINIGADKVVKDVQIGDSIAVNGVCLTVIEYSANHFVADVMPETVAKTNLKELKPSNKVNLERALSLGDRLGGHLVQGHVDAVGSILKKQAMDIAILYEIKAPLEVLKYTVPKGSIAIDGISLTVIDVFSDSFTVSLIPHTAENTSLGFKKPGETVNLESDILGRYVERLLIFSQEATGEKPSLNYSFLAENGFL
ncbi:MAG TPA: riboflavin synthase [Syntrophomonadaceae bacterium]|nr:riboflavin synthase [Syntrophomonadaceae bacterium]